MTEASRLWEPGVERAQASQMAEFCARMGERHGIDPRWSSVWKWSVEFPELFWDEMLRYAAVEPSAPAETVRTGEGMEGSRWFPGLRLNYARHLLRFTGDEDALIFEREGSERGRLSRDELRYRVARVQASLRADGVQRGDRVAGYLPNGPEAIVAMLAATGLGAIWSSCSPDFGVGGVLDRFGQIEPQILFVTDGYTYGGKRFETLPNVQELTRRLTTLRRVVVVPYLDAERDFRSDLGAQARGWREYAEGNGSPELQFEEVPFDHPLFILYSSGTTGVPKCIVHGHGGTLLQHMKELMLHTDLREAEPIFYFTTCGWMMWNWLVSSLGVGAPVVLYEGNPAFPSLDRLWELAASRSVRVFGTSPKFLAACEKADLHPGSTHDLAALRCLLSTGSPLSEELFRWVYREVKSDLQLSSICGGTDIVSCFILGNPLLPVYEGEIQGRGLGMNVEAWDEEGRPQVGRKGELVCKTPFPSQPVAFWNDPDGAKYHSAYFDVYPGVWRHGDFIEITPRGGVRVFGRSDATLNPGGVRIGTSEIYRLVENEPEVLDSIVVGRNVGEDVEIVLFVVLRDDATLDAALEERIRKTVAAGATKRHVPRHIRQVSAIPHTISGKKVELAVQHVLNGEEVTNRDALANPEALDQFAMDLDS